MTTVTLIFMLCGVATMTHGFMKLVEVLDR